VYDPDNYRGHRSHDFQRETLSEAKEEVYDYLDSWGRQGWVRALWEIRLVEIGGRGYDSGCRIFDTRSEDKRSDSEYDYSIVKFFLNDEEDEFTPA
jgi:hypothetical protein